MTDFDLRAALSDLLVDEEPIAGDGVDEPDADELAAMRWCLVRWN